MSSSSSHNEPTNPNFKNSEFVNSVRRSSSGNHFSAKPSFSLVSNQRGGFRHHTPVVNSLSDRSQRNSYGREDISESLRDYDDKENRKNRSLKPDRLNPRASLKGTMTFTSSTFSAASKTNVPARKKMLNERNEPTHSSVSFHGESCNQKKAVALDPTPTYLAGEEQALRSSVHDDAKVQSSIADDLDLTLENLTLENKNCVVHLDPGIKNSPMGPCSVSTPPMAPPDADAKMPPYDPQTNYLSPRPRFLHYKPNPRIKLYKEVHWKTVDGNYSSEGSSSDIEVTEEDEDISYSSDDVEKEQLMIVPKINFPDTQMDAGKAKSSLQPRSFMRRSFFGLILVLVIACLWVSVTDSPVIGPPLPTHIRFSRLYLPSESFKFVRAENIARNFRLWSSSLASFLQNVTTVFRKRHQLDPPLYSNDTTLLEEDDLVDRYLVFGYGYSDAEDEYDAMTGPIGEEAFDVKLSEPIESDEDIEEVSLPQNGNGGSEAQKDVEKVAANYNLKRDEEQLENAVFDYNIYVPVERDRTAERVSSTEAELKMDQKEDQPAPTQGNVEVQNEEAFDTTQGDNGMSSAEVELIPAGNNLQTLNSIAESEDSPHEDTLKDRISAKMLAGIFMLALSSLALPPLFFAWRQKTVKPKAALSLNQIPPSTPTKCDMPLERPPSGNWQTELCPSDMSSSQSITKIGLNRRTSEAKSQETKPRKNYRRVSLASSDQSLGSPSYGSFTTYEKIPIKHGNGEHEVFTPVRRSSRIRTQVTSL